MEVRFMAENMKKTQMKMIQAQKASQNSLGGFNSTLGLPAIDSSPEMDPLKDPSRMNTSELRVFTSLPLE